MKKFKSIFILLIVIVVVCMVAKKFITYPSDSYLKGIDVSEHQGDIHWDRISDEDLDFMIIRASYGTSVDQYFYTNYEHAKNKNLEIGVYHYLYASTVQEATSEANFLLKTIQGREIDLPIFLDIEDENLLSLPQNELMEIIHTFLETITNAGYEAGYYTNVSIYLKHLDINSLTQYPCWIAQYAEVLINMPDADYWQYSSTGSISGIDGYVDLDYKFKG